ncbi:MAG: ROK family glucokinase [Bifidobacteriaceae bacterium]|nr:ROK family glucokinase [Bifidobacteriaceae bacterium]
MDALGIDIGGTKIASGVYDDKHHLIQEWHVPTPRTAVAIDQQLVASYERAKQISSIAAIGISAAGNVRADRRTMSFSANIPAWIDYPLAEKLEIAIDHECPVIVENDANSAGWGEFVCGAGKDSRNMVMLTVGTGLGAAFVLDRHLYRGSFGMAAEVGHFPMVPDGRFCGCGLSGCAEKYVSGPALEQFAQASVRRDPVAGKRLISMAAGNVTAISGQMIFEAATDGDPVAIEAFSWVGQWLGRTMAAISALLDPDLFVIGGGLSATGDILLEPARRSYARYLQAAQYRPHAGIVTASAGWQAGMLGVADLAMREITQR